MEKNRNMNKVAKIIIISDIIRCFTGFLHLHNTKHRVHWVYLSNTGFSGPNWKWKTRKWAASKYHGTPRKTVKKHDTFSNLQQSTAKS